MENEAGQGKDEGVELPEFNAVWKKVQEMTGASNYTRFAEILGVSSSAVYDAKRKKSFPLIWAWKLSKKFGIGLDKLLGVQPTHASDAVDSCHDALSMLIADEARGMGVTLSEVQVNAIRDLMLEKSRSTVRGLIAALTK